MGIIWMEDQLVPKQHHDSLCPEAEADKYIYICISWIRMGCPVLITYLLTQWSRVLLEKLTVLQLVKKFPAFYGTRRFITTVTSARHLSLS
jgi:hypothetical protein